MKAPKPIGLTTSLSACLAAAAMIAIATPARATDPNANCGSWGRMVRLLTGAPHYEAQALLLRDRLLTQGHRFDLFLHRKAGEAHSYTLLRTHKITHLTCIVTAGQAAGSGGAEEKGRALIRMEDENHGDIYTLVTCGKAYVIMRAEAKMDLCREVTTTSRPDGPVASWGHIEEDHRGEIPWLP